MHLLYFLTSALAATASAATVPVQGTSGCGKHHILPGLTKYRGLKSSERARSYSVHLPADYDPATPYPVVLGFHGSSSVGLFFEVDTKLSLSRYSHDKIMVYPNGVGSTWAGANYSKVSVSEDLTFVSDLLADLRGEFCVDEARIYATGISNGAGFVNTLACNPQGASFAAFAPASGSYYTDNAGPYINCSPARIPLPILEIHGGKDRSVRYEGGEGQGGLEPAIPTWLGWWGERNRCLEEKAEDLFGGRVKRFSWTCGEGEKVKGVLQHWKVEDMGHCWASTEINFSQISVPEGPTVIDASRIIMDFFDRFTKT